ncbi:type II toxin-antitoxin system RelE/ParE family toxin [Sphingopyxis alaskensis]|uniref:type II toxin-antitoxin system RelE/ParE family toxin n=1 Tax=Sphingopyxis alaskensis TaxID=117207 RepID=UPI00391A26E7
MPDPIDNSANVLYEGHAYRLAETTQFARWFGSLRDVRAVAKIADRLKRASNGNFGDHKSVKGGVFEMRIDHGPGYRVYFFRRGRELVILLCGGDKRSQDDDVARAKRLKEEIEGRDGATTI